MSGAWVRGECRLSTGTKVVLKYTLSLSQPTDIPTEATYPPRRESRLYPFVRIHGKEASAALNSRVSYGRNDHWETLLRAMEGEKKGRWRTHNVEH